jgi:hypothetical protein
LDGPHVGLTRESMERPSVVRDVEPQIHRSMVPSVHLGA